MNFRKLTDLARSNWTLPADYPLQICDNWKFLSDTAV